VCFFGHGRVGHIAFDGTKLKANASVRQTRDRDGLEKEIERIKEQMRQMIQASVKIDALEDQKYPNGDGTEVAEGLRRKEYRLKKLPEASGGLTGWRGRTSTWQWNAMQIDFNNPVFIIAKN